MLVEENAKRNNVGIPAKFMEKLAGLNIPDFHGPIGESFCERFAVGGKYNRFRILVGLEHVFFLPFAEIKEITPRGRRSSKQAPVWRHRNRSSKLILD